MIGIMVGASKSKAPPRPLRGHPSEEGNKVKVKTVAEVLMLTLKLMLKLMLKLT